MLFRRCNISRLRPFSSPAHLSLCRSGLSLPPEASSSFPTSSPLKPNLYALLTTPSTCQSTLTCPPSSLSKLTPSARSIPSIGMTSQTSLLLIALCMGMASAGLFRLVPYHLCSLISTYPSSNCARLHHVVNLPYIAPTIADIGKCPPGCEPES